MSGVLWSVLTHHNNNQLHVAILRVEVASLPGIASVVPTHHALLQTMDRCMTHCSEYLSQLFMGIITKDDFFSDWVLGWGSILEISFHY